MFCFLWLQLFSNMLLLSYAGFLPWCWKLTHCIWSDIYFQTKQGKVLDSFPNLFFLRKGIWGSWFLICQMENFRLPLASTQELLVWKAIVFSVCHNKTAPSKGLFIVLQDRPGSPKYFHIQLLFWPSTFGNKINAKSLECAFKKCLNNPAHD